MSKAKSKSEYPVPVEPPELVAKRDRLLATLEKEAKTATGTAQPVLRKMYDLLANTKVGAPFSMNLYVDVKNAFVRFMKDPVLPPPPIIMECVEFMQERLVAVGFSGQMDWPDGAPPLPPAYTNVNLADGVPAAAKSAAPAAAPKRPRGPQDGFESGPARRVPIKNPHAVPPPAAAPAAPAPAPAASATPAAAAKSENQLLDSFKSWMRNSGSDGKLKG
jgi:hypothetical protein